ncbi:helix-turn-helix domain-containing protein [Candidatus Uhrbacteria bacterium]|nr:helix-turn-helix domain-containing protein [Candidatus Uhrbacteria bacterium]
MENIAILKNLGLSEPEVSVYLALLKIGGSLASTVAKEAGLKRTTIYAILKTLSDKGFVSVYFRKNKRYYYAEKPQRLAQYFEKKLELFTNIIPTLESLGRKQDQQLGLRFIETKEELEAFYTSLLMRYKNKKYCIIGSLHGWEDIDPAFFKRFRVERGRTNIKTRLLLTADSRTDNPADPKLLRDVRYLPAKYTFKSTIDIYPDQILIVSPHLSSLAVVVAVPAMVDIFKSIFEVMWEMMGDEQRETVVDFTNKRKKDVLLR